MSWFEDQVRQRELKDQIGFDDSIAGLAAAVMGKSQATALDDERLVAKLAIDEILKYYRFRPGNIPDSIMDVEERLDYCLRPHGLMQRTMQLEKGWHRDAVGPMIAYRKEDGLPIALIPRDMGGYWYRDPASGQSVRVTSRSESLFKTKARCFYRPLPEGPLEHSDLLLYIKSNIHPADAAMFVFITLMITIAGMMIPVITRVLTGEVLQMREVSLLLGTANFLLTVLISTALLNSARTLVTTRLKIRLSLSLEASVFMRILTLPVSFFNNFGSGDLAQRMQLLSSFSDMLIECIFTVGVTALMSIIYTIQLARFAPSLVAPALCVLFINVLLCVILSLLQNRSSTRFMENRAKAGGMSFALFSGIQKLRLAGAEKRAFSKWARIYAREASAAYDPPVFLKIGQAVIRGVSLLGVIIIYGLAIHSNVTPSEYMAFSSAYALMAAAFGQLSEGAIMAAKTRPVLDMLSPVLEADTEHSEKRSIVTKLDGTIEMNNVSFRYGEGMPDVIHDLSLRIRKGEYVAITGRSGCGKSTLFRLLLGFENPRSGSIYFDGHDLQTLDLHSLRRRIGTVIQNGTLIRGDIYSNIVISAPHLGIEDAWKAAEIAGIADDIREMPMGMQTIVTEGQGGISGGQKQRLMIARAIAADPSVLLMDEATSALDNVTQKKITEALGSLRCTRIVIAHRLSTIRQCDRILVMDDGHIIEEGTYEELLAKKGLFAELVERQRI